MASNGPVETKVTAATVGAALSALIIWILHTYVFYGEVPQPVVAAIDILIVVIVTFVAGWAAPHTPRATVPTDHVQ